MKYAIIRITPPTAEGVSNHQQIRAYNELRQSIEIAMQTKKDILTLGESAWQIPVEKSLPILAKILHGSHNQNLSVSVLFLEDPQWIALNP